MQPCNRINWSAIYSDLKNRVRNQAMKSSIPQVAIEDLLQDVVLRVVKHKASAIKNGKIDPGYLKPVIERLISEHKQRYWHRTNFVEYDRRYLEPKRIEQSSKRSKSSHRFLSATSLDTDISETERFYEDQRYHPGLIDGDIDTLESSGDASHRDPYEDVFADQLLDRLEGLKNAKKENLRKHVFVCFLEGVTDSRAIALKLGISEDRIKRVQDALRDVKAESKAEIKSLTAY